MSHEHDGEVEAATHHDLGLSGLNRLQRRLLFSLCILHTVRWQQNAGAGEAKIWKPFDAPMGLMYLPCRRGDDAACRRALFCVASPAVILLPEQA